MRRAGATGSLRGRLFLIGVVGLLYVMVVAVQLASVLRPAADELRGRTSSILRDHDRIADGLRVLRTARRDAARFVPPINVSDTTRRPLAEIRANVRALLDSGVALRGSVDRSGISLRMRILLAEALEQETALGVLLVEAIRSIETGHPEEAVPALRASGFRSDSADYLLSSAQRMALTDLFASQERLQVRLDTLERWALAWLGLGFVLFVAFAWFIRSQLLGPVNELETAVQRIALGDLMAEVVVKRDDELGRLGAHVNTMALRLRERAAEETARRESLTERFGRLLDESSNEIGVFDAATLRALQLNRGARVNLGLRPDEVAAVTLPGLLHSIERGVLAEELAQLRSGERSRSVLRTRQQRKDGSSYPVEMTIHHSVDRESSVFITVAEDAGVRERVRELDGALRDFAMNDRRQTDLTGLAEMLGAISEMARGALRAPRVSVWRESSGLRTCVGASDTDDATELATRRFPSGAAHLSLTVPAGARGGAILLVEAPEESHAWTPEEETFLRAVSAMVARALDTEERRLLEQALARAQRLDSIGQLAGGVAHDFNNILTAILGNLEVARAAVGPDASIVAELAEAEKAARRAADLTRQLLTFARHQRVDVQVADLNAIARESERMLRRLVGAEIEIETELHPSPLRVRLGAGQLEQVLMNLSVNARDAMPAGGKIRVSSRPVGVEPGDAGSLGIPAGRYVELRVVDTGVGMPANVAERVFDPFFTTKAPGAGTGLGLAVCYGIVRQAGGAIGVQSAPDAGTTFRVLLPLVEEAPAEEPAVPATVAGGGRETVLIAEDERVIRDLIQRALTRRGYQVLAAADGHEAMELARAHPGRIDLLVSDVVMPRVGGPELARALRRTDPGLRVLLMSGYSADALREGQDVPGSEFVPKPFTPDELARRVRALLDRGSTPASTPTQPG